MAFLHEAVWEGIIPCQNADEGYLKEVVFVGVWREVVGIFNLNYFLKLNFWPKHLPDGKILGGPHAMFLPEAFKMGIYTTIPDFHW